jgi:membrane protease YdiL (CAAX protease family)
LIWRLVFFLFTATLVWLIVGMLLPTGLQFASVALLSGGLVGGWATLALDGRGPGALGFYTNPAAAREAALGTALGVVVAMAVVAAIVVFGGLSWSAQAGTAGAWLVGSASSMLFLVLPAAAEEALLRGYPLQALAEAWGPAAALLVMSITFGAVHFGNPEATGLGLANIAAAGLLLGAVYLRTGSLWWATGVHLGWNWGRIWTRGQRACHRGRFGGSSSVLVGALAASRKGSTGRVAAGGDRYAPAHTGRCDRGMTIEPIKE